MAIIAIVGLHLAVAWVGTWLADARPMVVSLLTAWCSLGALWWVRCQWPSHVRTLAAISLVACAWAALVSARRVNFASDESAAWAASFGTQTCVAVLGLLFVEKYHLQQVARARQFSILFLLIWTTVVAVLLGLGRFAAVQLSWTTAALQWKFFCHLQVVAVLNALLAIGVWMSLQPERSLIMKLATCGLMALGTTLVANVLLATVFENVGASVLGVGWLYCGQALFIAATVVPLQELRRFELQAQAIRTAS